MSATTQMLKEVKTWKVGKVRHYQKYTDKDIVTILASKSNGMIHLLMLRRDLKDKSHVNLGYQLVVETRRSYGN